MFKKSIFFFLLMGVFLLLLLFLGQFFINEHAVQLVATVLHHNREILFLMRLSLYIGVIYSWPFWVDLIAKHRGLSVAHVQLFKRQRWKIFFFFAFVELFFVQNILALLLGR